MVSVDSWWDSLVRGRFQAVLELVLVAVSDDYMTVSIILKTINEWDAEHGPETWPARGAVPVSRPEVIRALRELARERYVQPCIFSNGEAHTVDFPEGSSDDVWFCATQKGIDAARRIEGSEKA